MVWMAICGFLAFLIQTGFALFDTGLCRAKNAANSMSTSFLVFVTTIVAFFAVGFALIGGGGLFLAGVGHNAATLGQFVGLLAFISIAAAVPAGALAERWSTRSYLLFTLIASGLVLPIYGGWLWGGGWLAQLGVRMGWGHGAVDFAGSGAAHLQGGALAIITARLLGPRIGKYDSERRPRAILGHHLPMVFLGTLLLAAGWFGLIIATARSAPDDRIGLIAANLILAAAAGTLSSAAYMTFRFGKPDPSMMCNGMLAGLVAIAAPCAFVQPWAALLIGLIAGVLVVGSVFFWEKRGIDDPVGAVSVHGVNGVWGLLALGLFADGTYGAGWNSVGADLYMKVAGKGVTGLFYGDPGQLWAQIIAAGVCIVWNLLLGGIAFKIIGKAIGGNRVPVPVELAGLDIPEVGAPAYPEFVEPAVPEQISRSEAVAAQASLGKYANR